MTSRHHRSLITLVAAAFLIALSGCSGTPGLWVGGSMGSGTRTVTRGDELIIRMRASATGAQTWRVSSFDSLMLRITQTARASTSPDGERIFTIRFTARTPGRCDVELRRIALGPKGEGEIGERRTFKVRIRER